MAEVLKLHQYSSCNQTLLQASDRCGCFYCLVIFKPDQIREYLDESDGSPRTALCPYCHVDAVLPDGKLGDIEVVITLELLTQMEQYWFGVKDNIHE